MFKSEVCIQAIISSITYTIYTQIFIRVRSSLCGIRLIITKSPVTINRHERIRCNTIESAPNKILILSLGSFLHCMRTGKIDMKFSSLSQIEVKVTTHIYTVITKSRIITFRISNFLINIPFVRIIDTSKIFHEFSTTTDINIGIIRGCHIFQQIVCPVYIRITFCLC